MAKGTLRALDPDFHEFDRESDCSGDRGYLVHEYIVGFPIMWERNSLHMHPSLLPPARAPPLLPRQLVLFHVLDLVTG